MNELPTLPDQNAGPSAAAKPSAEASAPPLPPPAEGAKPASSDSMAEFVQRPLTVAVIVLGLLLAAQTWSTHNRIRSLQEEMARSLKKGDISNAETGALARAAQESTKELQVKVGVLENRATEAQSQQLALEQLYQDMSKNRDEWALAEIEQVLSTASQQLQLSGNVPGALIALQNADRSLSRSDKPQFITIRRAIAKDIDKFKSLPSLDLIGVALRLDNAIALVDQLPTLSDAKLPEAAPPLPKQVKTKMASKGAAVVAPAPIESPLMAKAQELWRAWSSEMWSDVKQLVRVRTVDTPDALLMSPDEVYFMRENMKLRLLNARVALLSRNEAAFRGDLIAAQDALLKYFDTRAKATQTVQTLLRQVQGNNLAIELPTLSDSLNAVRNYKAKP